MAHRRPRSFDFAVVGAGAAGLAAARVLTSSGASVALFEARSRVGGRVWARPLAGGVADLGAEFIHGRDRHVFEEAETAGLQVLRIADRHVELRAGVWRPLTHVWRRFDRLTRGIARVRRDRSIAEYIAARGASLSASDRRLLVSMVEGFDAAPIEIAGANAISTAGQPPADPGERAQFRLASGWRGYLDWMHARLDPRLCRVLLATPVRRIAWSSSGARLSTDLGEYRTRSVLVTLPVGVLQAAPGTEGAVQFEPDPPRLRRALAGLAMGDVVRLVLRFREAFWRKSDSSRRVRRRPEGEPTFFHVPDGEFPTWWTSSPVESATLTLWAGGSAARSLLGRGRAEIRRRALRTLASSLGVALPFVRARLLGADSHDWSGDPFSRGAYSFARVGGASAGRALGQPFGDTLFFAGEAVATDSAGTVTAALASGRRAARRMLR